MTDPLGDLFGPFRPFLTRNHYHAGYRYGDGITHNPGDATYEHRQTASPKDGYPAKASDPEDLRAFLAARTPDLPSPAHIYPRRAGATTSQVAGPGGSLDSDLIAPHKGIEAGEVVAYRVWRINKDGFLTSWSMRHRWEPGVPMDNGTGIGVHSWRTYKQARKFTTGDHIVVGSVELWGEVTFCENGYLPDFAAIRSLDDIVSLSMSDREKQKVLAQLRARYGVGGEEPEAPSL